MKSEDGLPQLGDSFKDKERINAIVELVENALWDNRWGTLVDIAKEMNIPDEIMKGFMG